MPRWLTSILFPLFVLLGQLAVVLRLRRKPDGWRRTVGVGLRFEGSKFTLSAFGLQAPREAIHDLVTFLQQEPNTRVQLKHYAWQTIRNSSSFVDVVVCDYDTRGELKQFVVHLDTSHPSSLAPSERQRIEQVIVLAHAATRFLPEDVRPLKLATIVRRGLSSETWPYAQRVLNAICISCESQTETRFRVPQFVLRRTLGGWLHLVLRTMGDTVDVWMNVHHSAADGLAMQELLNRVQSRWPMSAEMRFPPCTLDPLLLEPRCDSVANERQTHEGLMFVDFTPLLELRRKWNTDVAIAEVGGATVGAVLVWQFAQQPEFAGTRFSTTADIAATNEYERDVDLISLRPSDFPNRIAFVKRFNELIVAGRARISPTRHAMQMMSLVPAWLQWHMLRTHRTETREIFGSVGVSIVKEASVIVPPLSDVGYEHGFITIGNLALPSRDGRRVGCVSAKGTPEQVRNSLTAIRRAIEGVRE